MSGRGRRWRGLLLVLVVAFPPFHFITSLAPPCEPCRGGAAATGLDRPRNQQSTATAAAGAAAPPPLLPRLLRDVFIVVAFAWNTQKAVHLEHTLILFIGYPTQVAITVVTDQPAKVRALLDGLGITGVGVWDGYQPASYGGHKYGILYEHRVVMRAAAATGNYSTYMYVEDDTRVPWPALVSWALDTEVLEPLGILRNFYRTEFRTLDGRLVLFDIINRCNLSSWAGVVRVPLPPGVPPCSDPSRFRSPERCVHEHYYQPEHPYMGMWVATHATLLRFMAHPEFTTGAAVSLRDHQHLGYGYPERSTGIIQLVNPRQNGRLAVMLPYHPCCAVDGPPRLAAVAAIGHTRNGYAEKPNTPLGKLAVEEALFYSGTPAPRKSTVRLRWYGWPLRWRR